MMRRRTYARPSAFRSWHVREILARYVAPALAGLAAGAVIAAPIVASILSA